MNIIQYVHIIEYQYMVNKDEYWKYAKRRKLDTKGHIVLFIWKTNNKQIFAESKQIRGYLVLCSYFLQIET